MTSLITINKLELLERAGDRHEAFCKPGLKATFIGLHSKSGVSLELPISVLKYERRGWKASLDIDIENDKEFPHQATASEAALKLADYLERMAIAIKDNPSAFDSINLNDIKI